MSLQAKKKKVEREREKKGNEKLPHIFRFPTIFAPFELMATQHGITL